MPTDPLVKTITEITEEALQPVQVPLVVGSDYFMVTQQDVRKIEITRRLNFSRVNKNGVLRPVEAALVDQLFELLRAIYFKNNPQYANQANSPQIPQQMQQEFHAMDISPPVSHTDPKASVQQQLKWNKSTSTSVSPCTLRYSCGTSTTDLSSYKNREQNHENRILSSSQCKKVTFTRTQQTSGTVKSHLSHLDAREQLKQRKKYSSVI